MAARYSKSFLFKARLIGKSLNLLSYVFPATAGKISFRIFCSPRVKIINPKQQAFLATADKRDFKYEGKNIALYHWPNSGPTVMLMHGWESQSGRWMNLISLLQKEKFNIISFDAPAHGSSDYQYFNPKLYGDIALAIANEYHPEYFAGHSAGGASLCYMLSRYDQSVAKAAVLMAAPASHDCIYDRYSSLLGLRPHMKKLLEAAVMRQLKVDPKSFDCRIFARDIYCTVLHIYDIHDDVVPASETKSIADVTKNSQIISFDDVGHRMKNDKVNKAVADFIILQSKRNLQT